jgi:hypothetical protein
MDCELLQSKPIITKNGISMVDLLTQSIQYQDYNFYIVDAFYLSEDLEMRADLLSQAVYGNNHNWDVILKFNGISNPFALSKEDFLLIPELGWMENQLYDPTEDDPNADVRSQYVDPTKVSPTDPTSVDYANLVKKLYVVNKNAAFNKVALPPNLAQFGDSEVKLVNNQIILGPNVTAGV